MPSPMKGPIPSSPQQRSALTPRNMDDDAASRNKEAKSSSVRSLLPKIGDPWAETPATVVSSRNTTPTGGAGTPTASKDGTPTRTTSSAVTSDTPGSSDTGRGGSAKGTVENGPISDSPGSVPPNLPSPKRQRKPKDSTQKAGERPKDASGLLPLASTYKSGMQRRSRDPLEQEQALFEQRLCEDAYGVAVRKINQYGKANLRYVKCVHIDDLVDLKSNRSLSSRSAGSKGRKRLSQIAEVRKDPESEKSRHALIWGKKKDVQITLDRFVGVRIGKVTERAKRNPSPASRVLSLLTNDTSHPSLDIEAPTRMDRDKFARAFAKFLDVPLEGEDTNSVHSAEFTPTTLKTTPSPSASSSAPGDLISADPIAGSGSMHSPKEVIEPEEATQTETKEDKEIGGFWQGAVAAANAARDASNQSSTNQEASHEPVSLKAVVELSEKEALDEENESEVSSLTGHGYDQELVEELHNALNELRNELEESRAEAARAVKVAEQAIQSAEKSSSQEWQNTVTHKAAEAAAMAQKRSAEAMAKQRLAEERLEGERRTAAFWRKQAEVAEEEAGLLQTRAAAAEVRKASIEEQLSSERRITKAQIQSMKQKISQLEATQLDALAVALEKNRELEIELEATRRDLASNKERCEEIENHAETTPRQSRRKMSLIGRKKRSTPDSSTSKTPLVSTTPASPDFPSITTSPSDGSAISPELLIHLKAEAVLMRQQYEHLRRSTTAELSTLPQVAKHWTDQVAGTLEASQAEIARLRERLAIESASRRKLLNEVQDLRGTVRVYCRPRPPRQETSMLSTPSQETLVLNRDIVEKDGSSMPMSFDFDRIFDPWIAQKDVYGEIEEVCLGVLDGYNITVMAFGQTGCGKTRTLLGEVGMSEGKVSISDHGIQLQAVKHLFSIAEHRSERFKDTFTLSIVEVHNERLSDMMTGTSYGEKKGQVIVAETTRKKRDKTGEDDASSGKAAKLEIRTDLHGDTVVQGALSIEIETFDEVQQIWQECITARRQRLEEQETNIEKHESTSHLIATLKVTSANIATGHGVIGKLQFVDMAGADLHRRQNETKDEGVSAMVGSSHDRKFANRSLDTLSEVVTARAQFVRSVPYRNSTLTHLLRDSLDGDTKVILLTCVSSDPSDIHEATATLRFASRMRQVSIGKATKHSLTSP